VWAISQAKQKKRSKHKGTLETEEVPALLNLDKLSLRQTREARIQVVVVLWRKMGVLWWKMVVLMKKSLNRLW
jgi:hypothetical protein